MKIAAAYFKIHPFNASKNVINVLPFKFRGYLEFEYIVTKNSDIWNSSVGLNIRILQLLVMFSYTFEIRSIYLSTKNLHFPPRLLTAIPFPESYVDYEKIHRLY